MNKGIYIALSGAKLKQKHMDIYAQNIANANTSGYKKSRITFKDFIIPVDNASGEKDGRVMAQLSGISTDFSAGTIASTGNTLDLAINGEGFFVLEDNAYTRNGRFDIDSEGYLVNHRGTRVLGDGGAISVQGSKIDINESGEIFVDDVSVGKLKIVDFPDMGVLRKIDRGVFTTEESGEEVNSSISQGYLENSNVDVIRELVQMIESHREFETYQKMIQAFDEASSKTINEMGK
jgi:flagellar basal-body rod protein FlgG